MQVIPAINESVFSEIAEKIKSAAAFGAEWVHLDVSDGKFTENKLWNNAFDLRDFIIANRDLNMRYEAHLMVENPENIASDWIDAGVSRIIIHSEAARDLEKIKKQCDHFDVELFVACNPDTLSDELSSYRGQVDGFLVLAVKPGKAGQKFREDQLEKIRFLRELVPNDKIIVDGGVSLENARQIREAGADILVAASAIWDSGNPGESYRKLKSI